MRLIGVKKLALGIFILTAFACKTQSGQESSDVLISTETFINATDPGSGQGRYQLIIEYAKCLMMKQDFTNLKGETPDGDYIRCTQRLDESRRFPGQEAAYASIKRQIPARFGSGYSWEANELFASRIKSMAESRITLEFPLSVQECFPELAESKFNSKDWPKVRDLLIQQVNELVQFITESYIRVAGNPGIYPRLPKVYALCSSRGSDDDTASLKVAAGKMTLHMDHNWFWKYTVAKKYDVVSAREIQELWDSGSFLKEGSIKHRLWPALNPLGDLRFNLRTMLVRKKIEITDSFAKFRLKYNRSLNPTSPEAFRVSEDDMLRDFASQILNQPTLDIYTLKRVLGDERTTRLRTINAILDQGEKATFDLNFVKPLDENLTEKVSECTSELEVEEKKTIVAFIGVENRHDIGVNFCFGDKNVTRQRIKRDITMVGFVGVSTADNIQIKITPDIIKDIKAVIGGLFPQGTFRQKILARVFKGLDINGDSININSTEGE